MPHNIPSLGAKPNGSAGAPVVGVERTQIGSASDVRQQGIRETDTKAAAKQQVPGIPSFEDNPLGAIGLILQEFAAGVRGTEGPVAKANKAAAQQMGARIQLTQARLNALKTAFDMIDASSPEQLEPTIKLITNAAPDFDLEESLRAHAEGKIENMKGTVEGALGNPLFQAFVAQTPGFENQPLKTQFEIAEKFNDFQFELQGKIAEQEALTPGRVSEAGNVAAAQREPSQEAAERAGKITTAKEAARQKAGGAESALLKGGAIKPSVTSEMRKIAGIAHGGTVIDELTGEVTGLNREQSENVVKVIAEAERLITTGKANSAGSAVIQAVKTVGLPEVLNPEIQISTGMREQLLDQRVEVTVLKTFSQDLLGDVSLGTGILSNLAAAMDATLGQVVDATFDGGVFFEDTQEARQDIRLFNQEVKRAIVNNPRFPVAEQKIVEKMLTDPNAWFKNPATAVVNFRQLIDWIDRKANVTGSLLAGKIPRAAKGGDNDELSAEVDRILGIQ